MAVIGVKTGDNTFSDNLRTYLLRDGLLNGAGDLLNPADSLTLKDPYTRYADIWRLYLGMLARDSQIYAMSEIAMQAVRIAPYTWGFDDVPTAVADFWQEQDEDAHSAFRQMLNLSPLMFQCGIFLGEVEWESDGARLVPKSIRQIPPWWYRLDEEYLPHAVKPGTNYTEPEPLTPGKYVLFVYRQSPTRPYGEGWLEHCFPSYLKKLYVSYAVIDTAQKFVQPQIWVQGPNLADVQSAVDYLTNNLNKPVKGARGDEKLKVERWETQGKEAIATYKVISDSENIELCKTINGVSEITEHSEVGSYAKAEVQKSIFMLRTFERVGARAAIIEHYVREWTGFVFGESAPVPDIKFQTESVADILGKIAHIQALQSLGIEFTQEYILEYIGMPAVEKKDLQVAVKDENSADNGEPAPPVAATQRTA